MAFRTVALFVVLEKPNSDATPSRFVLTNEGLDILLGQMFQQQ